ncbi:cytochrome c family protein [Sphingopyxis sp. USTB-05]|jgi:cytochrome c|uniref:c-type cytochrome n=2 Tax=unclassified Sphingopyxis TaxID=2614943 RepID=UPI002078B189|nr:cytochrome c family protein [Sphingopyxis sp. USTB-05]USI77938.1 cytochrome c family protein [Sphingopyxis sp. USTB-05]
MRLAPVLLAGALTLAGCGKSETPAEAPAAGESAVEAPAVEPTAAMGEQIFRRCVACHTIDKGGANGIGPNLHGVVGRAVASHPGFSYSGAMKAKGGIWDEAALGAYLEAPMKNVPGTRMAFAGVIDAADRKALILYLEAQSK